jgi:hypothetical protein
MSQVAGIQFEKNEKDNRNYVCIDLNLYEKNIQPFLVKIGAMSSDYDKEWEEALTPGEFMQEVSIMLKHKFNGSQV